MMIILYLTSALCIIQGIAGSSDFDYIFKNLEQFESKIVGGSPVLNRTECPYQVSLLSNPGRQHFCAGSVLNQRTIITAAHCVSNRNASSLLVATGHLNLTAANAVIANVSKIVVHPQFNATTLVNDVAIIQLSSNLTLNSNISPIVIATVRPAVNSSCMVTGWGVLNENSTALSNVLMKVNVSIVSDSVCNMSYPGLLTRNMVCAAAPLKDSCQGDSGGPLVFNRQLVGIVSFGVGCARPNYPGVYTDTTKFVQWIQNNTVKALADNEYDIYY